MIDKKWLEMCATAGELLYGNYSVAALRKLYEQKPGHTISNNDLITTMQELEAAGSILMTYGLSNAITRASQDVSSYDRATEMEGIGWSVATMPASQWKEMNS